MRMKFKLENTDETLDGALIKALGNNEFLVKIRNHERNLKILEMSPDRIEFMLDNSFHSAKYIENSTSSITLVVDGVKLTFNKRPDMDKIVYKNSGPCRINKRLSGRQCKARRRDMRAGIHEDAGLNQVAQGWQRKIPENKAGRIRCQKRRLGRNRVTLNRKLEKF